MIPSRVLLLRNHANNLTGKTKLAADTAERVLASPLSCYGPSNPFNNPSTQQKRQYPLYPSIPTCSTNSVTTTCSRARSLSRPREVFQSSKFSTSSSHLVSNSPTRSLTPMLRNRFNNTNHHRNWEERIERCVSLNRSSRDNSILSSLSVHTIQPRNFSTRSRTLSLRYLHSTGVRWDKDDRSKVEATLAHLRQELQEEAEKVDRKEKEKVKLVKKSQDEPKEEKPGRLAYYWGVTKDTIRHYAYGFWLLFVDIRISTGLTWRMVKGEVLNRRERKQEAKQRANLKLKLEMARFLQDATEEIAMQRTIKEDGESKALEFAQFIKKVRNEGGYVSNMELLKFTKLFEDELTLDNLSFSQLRALCKIVGVTPIGTQNVLRFQLAMKLRELRTDDRLIAREGGVDKLTVPELQAANRARGMRALGLSKERLKIQLTQWLELSLNDRVPPSLLLLSRAMYLPEDMSFTDRLKNLVAQLPDSMANEARMKMAEVEGGKIGNRERLLMIQGIDEVLQNEREAEKMAKEIEIAKKEKDKEKEFADLVEKVAEKIAIPLEQEITTPVLEDSATILKEKRPSEQLEYEDIREIETLLHEVGGGELHEEKEDLAELKEQVMEHKEDVAEVHLIAKVKGEELLQSKAAQRLQKSVDKLISKADNLLVDLHGKRNSLAEEIKQTLPDSEKKDKKEQLVLINELVLSVRRLQKVPDDTKTQRVLDALTALDDDHDGAIDLKLALDVIEMIGKENVKINAKQMTKIKEMLSKEQDLSNSDDEDSNNNNNSAPKTGGGSANLGSNEFGTSEKSPKPSENKEKVVQ